MKELSWGDIKRLELKPGDQFVMTLPCAVTKEMADRVRQTWKEFVGGDDETFRLLILQEGMKLGVINLASSSEPPDRDHMLNG